MPDWVNQILGGLGLAGVVIAGLAYTSRVFYLRNVELSERQTELLKEFNQKFIDLVERSIRSDLEAAAAMKSVIEFVRGKLP